MQKMLFVAVLLCDFYANCADIMQIVLFLCKLWGFYANSAVLMQIVLFWCKLSHLSQFTLFCRKWHFCRKIRALAGTFGSAIRRRLLLMMSECGFTCFAASQRAVMPVSWRHSDASGWGKIIMFRYSVHIGYSHHSLDFTIFTFTLFTCENKKRSR